MINPTLVLDEFGEGVRVGFGPRRARDSRGEFYASVRIETKTEIDAVPALLLAMKAEIGPNNRVEIRSWPEILHDDKTKTFAGYARLSHWTEVENT